MADSERLTQLLELLADQIDDLKEQLQPLTSAPLCVTASKLPLLDKAKLQVLVSYSIESLLFNSLRLSEVKTKDHPIMTEITRVRQYVQKLKQAEKNAAAPEPESQNLKLDKAAAGRILGAAMREYDRADKKRTEEQAREKEAARKKLEAMGPATRDPLGKRASIEPEDEEITGLEEGEDMDVDEKEEEVEEVKEVKRTEKPKSKKDKRKSREDETPEERKKRRAEKKQRKEAKKG